MPQSSELYEAAKSDWKSVDWPREAFDAHCALVDGQGSPHEQDLYVTGAAGFRQSAAWEAIDERFRGSISGKLSRMNVPGSPGEDLWQRTLERLLKEDPDFPSAEFESLGFQGPPHMLVRYAGRRALPSFLYLVGFRIGLNEIDRQKLRTLSLNSQPLAASRDDGSPLSELDDRERVVDVLREVFRDQPREDVALFSLVFFRGMSRKAASRFLGWSDPSKATRRLQRLGGLLLEALRASGHDGPTGAGPRDAERLIASLRRAMQDAGAPLSGEMTRAPERQGAAREAVSA